jgi:hypothetical protein
LHDNEDASCALNVKQFLASKSICVILHPPTRQIWYQQTFSLPEGETGANRRAFQRQ